MKIKNKQQIKLRKIAFGDRATIIITLSILGYLILSLNSKYLPLKKSNSFEECIVDGANSNVNKDDYRRKITCTAKNGEIFIKEISPSPQPMDKWIDGQGYSPYDERGYIPKIYFRYSVPSSSSFSGSGTSDSYWGGITISNLEMVGGRTSHLHSAIIRNSQNQSLQAFIHNYSFSQYFKESFPNQRKLIPVQINSISGYRLVGDYTYVFLKRNDNPQIIIFAYETNPSAYHFPETISIYEQIIESTKYIEEGI